MNFDYSDEYKEQINKIKKKDHILYQRIIKKLVEVAQNPEHYKPLRNVLKGNWRVQFGSYVLQYVIEGDTIYILSITHHDQAY